MTGSRKTNRYSVFAIFIRRKLEYANAVGKPVYIKPRYLVAETVDGYIDNSHTMIYPIPDIGVFFIKPDGLRFSAQKISYTFRAVWIFTSYNSQPI